MTTSATTSRAAQQRRLGGRAGLTAAFLFPGLIVLTTALQWDWMHDQLGWSLTQETYVAYPSGLSNGPVGFLQIANFALTGLLLLVFGWGLASTLRAGVSRHVTRFGVAVMGIALMTSSFPTDLFKHPTAATTPDSWHGWIHEVSFFVLMVLGVLPATIGFAINARCTAGWRRYALPTLLVPLTLVAMIAGVVPDPFSFYLLILVWFGWIGLVSLRLTGQASSGSVSSG